MYTLFGSMAPIVLFGSEIAPARLLVIGFSLFSFWPRFSHGLCSRNSPTAQPDFSDGQIIALTIPLVNKFTLPKRLSSLPQINSRVFR